MWLLASGSSIVHDDAIVAGPIDAATSASPAFAPPASVRLWLGAARAEALKQKGPAIVFVNGIFTFVCNSLLTVFFFQFIVSLIINATN